MKVKISQLQGVGHNHDWVTRPGQPGHGSRLLTSSLMIHHSPGALNPSCVLKFIRLQTRITSSGPAWPKVSRDQSEASIQVKWPMIGGILTQGFWWPRSTLSTPTHSVLTRANTDIRLSGALHCGNQSCPKTKTPDFDCFRFIHGEDCRKALTTSIKLE